MSIWRIAGAVFVVGLALFLITLLLKVLLIASIAFLLVRVVGGKLASRYYGRLGRRDWVSSEVISIDNPAYRSPVNSARFERVVSIY